MATLRGKITDVTHKPPESLSSITVKAPSVRVGGGTDLIVSSPATVDFDRDTGDVTISGLTGGLSWLCLEGEGWSDSIALSVAEGMISLIEAIANASSAPGIIDYLRLLADFKIRFDETAQDAVDAAADEIKWLRPNLAMGTDLNSVKYPGIHPMSTYGAASSATNRPTQAGSVNPGFVEVHVSGHRDGLLRQVWVTTPEAASSESPFRAERWFRGVVNGVEQWTPWKSDANAGYVKAPLEMGADVHAITETGAYPIPSYFHAASLVNRPTQSEANNMGMLWVASSTHRNNTRKLTWETYPEAGSASLAMKLVSYYEGDTAGTWTPWEEEKSGSGDSSPLEITVVDAPPGGLTDKVNELQVKVDTYTAPTISKLRDTHVGSGFKVVPLSITLGTGNGVTEAASGSWRMPVLWNAPILRWRLCVTTRNPRFGNTPGNDVVLRRVTWGQHSGNAAFSSAPATIEENFTVPGNGDIVRMPWQNTPITEGQEHLLAFDWASSDLVQANMGSGWSTTNEADSVSPGTTTRKIASPLDWWIEAETYSTTPTVAVLGDSISSGHSADTVGPVGSWLGIYMRQKRGLPVHYSAGGEKARDWWQHNDYKRTRWADLSKADACIFALGYNDAADGADPQTFEQYVANVMECLPIAREYISQNIYGVTITPSVNLDAGREAERVKMNEWIRSERSIFRDVFDFEQAVIDPATGGLLPAYGAADGTHLSSAGYGQLAATITRPVTTPPVMYQTI